MALSGSYYGPTLGDGYQRVRLDWTATQNIANNTSTISAKFYFVSTGFSITSSTLKNVSITIAGTTYTGQATASVGANSSKLLLSASQTVGHNADGTLTTSISGWFELKLTISGTTYNSTSASGSPVLDTIPRASIVTSFPDFTIGNGVTVWAPRYSTSFTNSYHIYANGVGILGIEGQGDSYTFSAAQLDPIYAQIPQSTSALITVYILTYSGGTQIGTTQWANAACGVGYDIVPVLSSITAVETISHLAATLPGGTYLQSLSRPQFTINGAGGAKSSWVTSYNINFNGVNYGDWQATTGTINTSGTLTATATVTDSRGRVSAPRYVDCSFLAFPSAISSFPSFTIGSGVTVTLPRAHANLKNIFQMKIGGTVIHTTAQLSADSYTFTAAELDAIYGHIPAATAAAATLIATTYAGATSISAQTANATASVGSSIIPTFTSVTAAETITYLALSANTFLQNVSRVRFTLSGAAGIKNSTIASYNVNFNGVDYGTSTPLANLVNTNGSVVATATVTDTRGRVSSPRTISLTFLKNPMNAITFNNFPIGSDLVVSSDRAHTSFTNTFVLKIGAFSATKAGIASNSTTFTAADLAGIYAQIPTSTTGIVTLEVQAFSQGTAINSVESKTAVGSIDTAVIKPSLSTVTVAEGTAAVNTLAMGNNVSSEKYFAQNLSKVAFTINGAAGSTGSAVASYNVNFNSVNYAGQTSTTAVLNITGRYLATATVTDQRGIVSAAKTIWVEFLPYALPIISQFTALRHKETAPSSGIYIADILGTFIKTVLTGFISSLNGKNQLTYVINQKLRSAGTWTQALSVPLTVGVTALNTQPVISTFLITESYDIQLLVSDKFNTVNSTLVISTGAVPLSLGKTGVGIGKVWQQGSLDIQGDIYIDGLVRSLIATGTAPLDIVSTTVVPNLNVDMLDGKHASDFALLNHAHTTYDRASSVLTGANVFSNIVVTDGIVTSTATRALTAADVSALALSGGTLIGDINFGTTLKGIKWAMNTDYASIYFKNTGDGDTDSYLAFEVGDNGDEYFKWMDTGVERMNLKGSTLTVSGTIINNGVLYTAQAYQSIGTPYGAIEIGARNGSWGHIYTDRPAFYLNKEAYVLGGRLAKTNWGSAPSSPAAGDMYFT